MYPYQSPMPYGKRITFLLSCCTFLGIILCGAAGTNTIIGGIGAAFFAGAISVALVIDWRGVVSLRGLTDWSRLYGKKKFWLIVAWICLFPLFFCIYLVRVAMYQFGSQAAPIVPAAAPRRVKVGLVVGSLVICIGLISAFGSANGATVHPAAPSTQTVTSSLAQGSSTQVPALLPTDTPTPKPKPSPTPRPAPKPSPQPTAKPTPKPKCQAVNNNPWCYNFSPGNLIYNPPAAFCDYFACIGNFWNETGYVNECADGMYSKSGGHRGDCSYHGGELRPLYSH